jgi:ubiquinone/menaquinone biosynthesis C-methylase UbiE
MEGQCDVTAIDYVPALIDEARARANAEGLSIEFREADAENLPLPDGSFDYVLSAIGVMFTADQQRAARELLRLSRAGGTVGVLSWTPAGFIGQMLKVVRFFLEHYGPTLKASQRLDQDGRRALRDDLIDLAARSNRASGGSLIFDWEYLIAVARKP